MALPDPGAPTRVGRYEVICHLATGGMAQIYLARQSGLGSFERHVVLKTILRERANDQRFIAMFLDEAKLAATLNHQNIAQVFEVDQAGGAYFMAMEYVHGENARAILEQSAKRGARGGGGGVPVGLAVTIVGGAAAGLHHAHERRGKQGQPLNIVHRDISPANIMVGYDGSVKVLDFGIAKAEERVTKTAGGTIKGKYGYMSPEQCRGKPVDRRSDIFALGICLYELTTLRRAFKGHDDFETMKRIVAGDVVLPSVCVPGFPRELEAIIMTAMANEPEARFQSAREMIDALDAFATRAKLGSSSAAVAKFMTELFGNKREPWVEQAERMQTASDADAEAEVELGAGSSDDATAINDRAVTMRPDEADEITVTPEPSDASISISREEEEHDTLRPGLLDARDFAAIEAVRAAHAAGQITLPESAHAAADVTMPVSYDDGDGGGDDASTGRVDTSGLRTADLSARARAVLASEQALAAALAAQTVPVLRVSVDTDLGWSVAPPHPLPQATPPQLPQVPVPPPPPLPDAMQSAPSTLAPPMPAPARVASVARPRGWLMLIALIVLGLAAGAGIAMYEDSDSGAAHP